MKRRALFIGVNEYEDPLIRNLNYSLSDAHALKTLFELFGYQTDILENPAKSDVFSTVREMTRDLAAGDIFFFYFAGHGWTTTSGSHLLFCKDDMYEDLRYEYNVGIPFDILKKRTEAGGYNRAFVLDACRSDFITGTRGDDATTRDLRPVEELVKDAPTKSSLAVLRSCSKYEHALEIESRKHGLFTLAMMDVLRASKETGAELLFGESLCDAITQKMSVIARAEGIAAAQTPEFAKSGIAQVLISGYMVPSSASPSGTLSLVVCPACGFCNAEDATFRCNVCGRDHLCRRHYNVVWNCCADCANERIAAREEEQQERFAQNFSHNIRPRADATGMYSVVLRGFGSNKPSVFKELQKICNAELFEIKRSFKSVPAIVMRAVSKDDAKRCKVQLENVGADVAIGHDGFLDEIMQRAKKRKLFDNDAVYTITVSIVLLSGTYVLAKLLVWRLFM